MNVTIKSNWFGRPYKGYAHHYVTVNFAITGGSGQYEYRRNLYGNWTGWDAVQDLGNKDGYAINTYFFHLAFPIEIRDKNNTSLVWADPNFDLLLKNGSTALASGTTPVIVSQAIAVGDTSITVKAKASDFIQIYLEPSADYNQLSEPIASGFAGLSGTKLIQIPPAVAGGRYFATAQSLGGIDQRKFSFESLMSQYIEVGGIKKVQLEATVEYLSDTPNGKSIRVTSVTGGSGSYKIDRYNSAIFDIDVNQTFEIPFGMGNIYVRDLNESNEVHISVMVDGGIPTSQSQTYSHNIRTQFSNTQASQNNLGFNIKYGKKTNSVFDLFNEFGTHDQRQSWAKTGIVMPQIGIDENQGTLANNRVLMHPWTDSSAVIRYEIQKAGNIVISGDAMRAGINENPWSNPPQTGLKGTLKIYKNGTELASLLLDTKDEVKTYNVNANVQIGDVVDLEIQNTFGDGSFGHYHVSSIATLTTNGAATTQTPQTPVLAGNSPQLVGSTLTGTGNGAGQYVVIFKDGIPHSLAITDGSGGFSFGALKSGVYAVRNSTDNFLSLESNTITVVDSLNQCPVPTIVISKNSAGNTVQIGGGFTLEAVATNVTNFEWYKDNVLIAGATGSSYLVNNATAQSGGVYACKAVNCGTATTSTTISNEISITISGVDCSNLNHLSNIGVWQAVPTEPFVAIKFHNTGTKPFVGQIVSYNPLRFVIRGKNSVSSANLQGNLFTFALGIGSWIVDCLGGANTNVGGLEAPTDFPMPPNYEVVNGVYQPINLQIKKVRVASKMANVAPCNLAMLQFGYSNLQSQQPTNWIDSQGVARLIVTGGVTTEVATGGDTYLFVDFDLTPAIYHFFARQKDEPTNVSYISQFEIF
jgi:hypothetical protein